MGLFQRIDPSFYNRAKTRQILDEFGVSSPDIEDLIERLGRVGNTKARKEIQKESKLRGVLMILTASPEEWTEEDKFIKISNYLEYGR